MSENRILRVQRDLLKALAMVFIKNNMAYVYMKNIYMSKDLRNATIEVSSQDYVISNEEMIALLEKKIGWIKRELRKHINWKYFPNIKFVLDSHKDRVDNLEKIMEEIAKEKEEQQEIISDCE